MKVMMKVGEKENRKKALTSSSPINGSLCFSPAHTHAPSPGGQCVAPQTQSPKVTTCLSFFITSEINGSAQLAGGKKNLYRNPSGAPTPPVPASPPPSPSPHPIGIQDATKKKKEEVAQ